MVPMRRALVSGLLLGLLVPLGLVCACAGAAADVADDHGCCVQEGFGAATACCLSVPGTPPAASLDAASPPVAPEPRTFLVVASPLPALDLPARSVSHSASPPSILRI